MKANDFTTFVFFVKGLLAAGEVIKQDKDRQLVKEFKLHFNRIMAASKEFEKELHKGLGPEFARGEDDMNSEIFTLVWNVFNTPPDVQEAFINHMKSFNTNEETPA